MSRCTEEMGFTGPNMEAFERICLVYRVQPYRFARARTVQFCSKRPSAGKVEKVLERERLTSLQRASTRKKREFDRSSCRSGKSVVDVHWATQKEAAMSSLAIYLIGLVI